MWFRFLYPPLLGAIENVKSIRLTFLHPSRQVQLEQHAPRACHSFLHQVLLSPSQTGEDIRRRCIRSAIWEQGWWRLSLYIPVPPARHEYQLLQHASSDREFTGRYFYCFVHPLRRMGVLMPLLSTGNITATA